MTDRKAKHRARNKAGFKHVSGWVGSDTADDMQADLMTGDEVDAVISKQQALRGQERKVE